ncbi:hypothetical protein F52700_4893 [Fusarium sp. NRRL 52700]|nr:hypothetical protein F52700_4893 [Fusarium sp. NRRL 52700]
MPAAERFGAVSLNEVYDDTAQSFMDSLRLAFNEKAGPDGAALEWGGPDAGYTWEWHIFTITINAANLTRTRKRNILEMFRAVFDSQVILPRKIAHFFADPEFLRTLGDPFVTVTMNSRVLFRIEFRVLQGAIDNCTPALPLEFIPSEDNEGDNTSIFTGDVVIDTTNLSKSDKRKILTTFTTVFNDCFSSAVPGSITFAADPGFLETIAETVLAADFDSSLNPTQMEDLVVMVPSVAPGIISGEVTATADGNDRLLVKLEGDHVSDAVHKVTEVIEVCLGEIGQPERKFQVKQLPDGE